MAGFFGMSLVAGAFDMAMNITAIRLYEQDQIKPNGFFLSFARNDKQKHFLIVLIYMKNNYFLCISDRLRTVLELRP